MHNKDYKALRSLALKMVSNPEDADDLVQEAFLAYKKHVAHTPIESTPMAYLHGIIVNKCRNTWRSRINRQKVKDEYEQVLTLSFSSRNSVYEEVMVKDLTTKCLAVLQPGEKKAFTALLDCQDRGDMVSAAKEIGSNYNTFKAHILHARRKLQKLM